MKITTIVWETVFMAVMAVVLINIAMRDDGVGAAIVVVGVSMFACWRLAHPK